MEKNKKSVKEFKIIKSILKVTKICIYVYPLYVYMFCHVLSINLQCRKY